MFICNFFIILKRYNKKQEFTENIKQNIYEKINYNNFYVESLFIRITY